MATVVAAKPSVGVQVDASAIPVLGEAAFRSLAVALGALGAGRQTGLVFSPIPNPNLLFILLLLHYDISSLLSHRGTLNGCITSFVYA